MTPLISFPGGQAQKDALLAAIKADKDADRLIRGTYGKKNGEFRGCAVGCTIHALDPHADYEDHSAYERLIGVPEELARLEDSIFENLPESDAMEWPERFTAALPVGKDLRPAYHRFTAWMLADPEGGVIRFADDLGREVIGRVAYLHERAARGDYPPPEEWAAARVAANAAASAAAWDAGSAAWDAARVAARDAAWKSFADRLVTELEVT